MANNKYMDHWTKPTEMKDLHHLIAGNVPWERAEQDALEHAKILLPNATWAADIKPSAQFGEERECPILEVGCGIGRLMKVFLMSGHVVSGSDISRKMLEEAKQYLKEYNVKEFGRGHLRALILDNPDKPLQGARGDYFGFIYSMLVFQHLPTLPMVKNMVKAIHRSLRPGGIARIQTLVGKPKDDRDAFHPWIGSLFTDANAFADVFSQAGFNIIEATRGQGYKDWLWVTARKPKV